MAKIYVVRHGETEGNAKGILHGITDTPLDDVGRKQVAETGIRLQDIKFNAVYSSPLSRAYETGEIILEHNKYGGKIVKDKRLIERNFGVCEGTVFDVNNLNLASWANAWNESSERFIEGGDTIADMFNRVGEFLQYLKKKYKKNEKILITTHCGTERTIYFHFNKKPADGNLRKARSLGNAEVAEYDLNLLP